MFDDVKEYLNGLTPKQKTEMINNLKEFNRLRCYLTSQGVLEKSKRPDEMIIVKKHPQVADFKAVYHRMTLQGIKIIDKTEKQKKPK